MSEILPALWVVVETVVLTLLWQTLQDQIRSRSDSSYTYLLLHFVTSHYHTAMHFVNYHVMMHFGIYGYAVFYSVRQFYMVNYTTERYWNPIYYAIEYSRDQDPRNLKIIGAQFAGAWVGGFTMQYLWILEHCNHDFSSILSATSYCSDPIKVELWMAILWEGGIVLVDRLSQALCLFNDHNINSVVRIGIQTADKILGVNYTRSMHAPNILMIFLTVCPSLVDLRHVIAYTIGPALGILLAKPVLGFLRDKTSIFTNPTDTDNTT